MGVWAVPLSVILQVWVATCLSWGCGVRVVLVLSFLWLTGQRSLSAPASSSPPAAPSPSNLSRTVGLQPMLVQVNPLALAPAVHFLRAQGEQLPPFQGWEPPVCVCLMQGPPPLGFLKCSSRFRGGVALTASVGVAPCRPPFP